MHNCFFDSLRVIRLSSPILFAFCSFAIVGCSESNLEDVANPNPDDSGSEVEPSPDSSDPSSTDAPSDPSDAAEQENRAPEAVLHVSPLSGVLPLEVQLDASGSSDADGDPLRYRFDFDGDGQWDTEFGSTATVARTFSTAGEYLSRVEVQDDQGESDIATGDSVVVSEPQLPGGELLVNILVDANRDGVLSPADEAFEDVWDEEAGAIFPPNLDDDDGDGQRDGLNPGLDGEDDLLDMAPVRLLQVNGLTDTHSAILEVSGGNDTDGVGFIRIFRQDSNQNVTTLLEAGDTAAEIPIEWLTQGNVELYLEGILGRYIGFAGVVRLSLQLYDGDTVVSSDSVELRGSPIILNHHLASGNRLFVTNIPQATDSGNNIALINAFEAHLPESIELYKINGQSVGWDRWAQDSMQTGFTQWPGSTGFETLRVHMQLERDGGLQSFLPNELLSELVGYVYPHGTGSSLNYGGNLEVLPPHTLNGQDFPFGRIVVGGGEEGSLYGASNPRRMAQRQIDFFSSQGMQGPTIEVSSEWLAVGHIDEIFLVLPNHQAAPGEREWVVLLASPSLAIQNLEEAQAAGFGEAAIFENRVSSGWGGNSHNYETTPNLILSDTDLMGYQDLAQARIDSIQQVLMDEAGLVEADFRYVPVLYEYENWGGIDEAVAYNPGIQNLVMADTQLFIPDPEGPNVDGEDVWQTQTLEALSGLGMEAHFVDVFFSYHTLMGEAHCGTNFEREPESLPWWNQD